MKVAREKGFERLCKLGKGDISRLLSLIRTRHFESIRLSDTSVTQINSSQWIDTSSDSTRHYIICEDMKVCPINCHLQCTMCNIRVHLFSCNSRDALINHTICKHIHLVAKQNKSIKIPLLNISVNLGDCLPTNEIHTSLLDTTVEQQPVEVANIRSVQEKLIILISQAEQCALFVSRKSITSAMPVLNVIDDSTAYIVQQLQQNNLSRHEKPKRRYAKPSRQEEQQIKEALLHDVNLY